MRLERYSYFMEVAVITAKRSTCTRLSVGCVLMDKDTNRLAALGYNGSIKGAPHCIDDGCLMREGHCIRTVHAEVNAVSNLIKKYGNLVCFVTHQPCINCFKTLVANGVKSIFYLKEYEDAARDLLNKEIKIPMLQVYKDEYSESYFTLRFGERFFIDAKDFWVKLSGKYNRD
jgi:dCMP deaminase